MFYIYILILKLKKISLICIYIIYIYKIFNFDDVTGENTKHKLLTELIYISDHLYRIYIEYY